MPYPIADPKDLDRLSPGDQITADVVVTPRPNPAGKHRRGEEVRRKERAAGTQLPSEQEGPVPDFALVNQDGKRIHLGQYRGSRCC